MEYIDYDELCITDAEMAKEEHPFDDVESGFVIDPLPLLTCEGNGRGGGDFRGHDDRVGMWARDIISIEETAPAGYEQIDGCFKE